ncbi:amino acid adenylation domain-containing protein [Kitasatospora sp. GP30]|uniref:non-ribosomal peptide synthetase n=1 Tax=Kitasatospora sp. GP30 TaxID=3035084 RepID=UPI000C7039D2|nr:non-ribosomal peptide synthetase [Kitasatospora sp. GP30]MDH6145770.1 amino acid adenylation domain-containing protein [Kitasatospora sp. GP30]
MTNTQRSIEDVLPLSPLQHGLLFQTLYDNEGPDVYTVQLAVELSGTLDTARLRGAAGALLARHPNLRALFVHEGLDQPVQVVRRTVELPWRELDLSDQDVTEAAKAFDALRDEERANRFALDEDVLLRFVLVHLAGGAARLLLTLHHILVDGWSVPILLDDLFELYERGGDATGMRRVAPYRDYLAWLARQDQQAASVAWEAELAGLAEPTLLGAGRQGAAALLPEVHRSALSVRLTEQLAATARSHGWTVNTMVQAAWGLVLGHHLGRTDVVFGGTVSGRPPELTGVETIVGLLINTLPVRVGWHSDERLAELFEAVQRAQSALLPHQHMQLATLQSAAGHGELFDTTLVFENYPVGAADAPQLAGGLRITDLEARDATHYGITLLALPGDQLRFQLAYRTDVVDRATAARLADWLHRFLTAAAEDPTRPIADVPLLDAGTRHRLLTGWNDTAHAVPEVTLTALLETAATGSPEAPALLADGESVSYAELHASANRLARALVARGAGPDRPVAIALHRGRRLVEALLAVLKAGSPYLPIDPELPAGRISRMLAGADPVCVLADRDTAAVLPAEAGPEPLLLDGPDLVRELAVRPAGPLADAERSAPLDPRHLAYLIYTSGSTGLPKGVGVPHTGIVNRLLWMQDRYRLGPDDRVLQKTPFGFDVSVWEFFWPLLTGAALVMARPGGHREPAYLAEEIAASGVTTVHFVPSMLDAFLREPAAARCAGVLRRVVCSGEALAPATQDRALSLLGAPVHNLYGPTEAAVDVTHWDCLPGQDPVPIGRPVWNTRVYVLDAALRPVAPGVAGELYLAGRQLARGYLGRPGLTAERFTADPHGEPGARMYRSGDLVRWTEDGALEYLGRTDDQVKIRGLRIELGEIESVLSQLPGVAQVRVVVRQEPGREGRLVGYLVPDSAAGTPPQADALRAAVAAVLPGYMVPSAFVMLAELPLSINGKLDRRALPAPELPAREDGRAPRTATEQLLCSVFAEVLGLPEVAPEQSFFELGGHSLSAALLLPKVRAALGAELTLRTVFAAPTPAALAAVLADRQGASAGLEPVLALRAGGALPPLFCLPPGAGLSWCYAGLLGGLDREQPLYGLQAPGLTGGASPETLAGLARGYAERITELRPHGPYRLLGWSAGGNLAHEVAVLLQERGERVERLVILDSYPPAETAGQVSQEQVFRDAFGAELGDPADPVTRARALELVREELGRVDDTVAAAVLETYLLTSRALLNSRPRRFDGDLLFFRAADWTVDPRRDAARWQRHLTGGIEIQELTAIHEEIARPDVLAEIGKILAGRFGEPPAAADR